MKQHCIGGSCYAILTCCGGLELLGKVTHMRSAVILGQIGPYKLFDLIHILFVKLRQISQKKFGKNDGPMRSHLATHTT